MSSAMSPVLPISHPEGCRETCSPCPLEGHGLGMSDVKARTYGDTWKAGSARRACYLLRLFRL